MKFFKSLMFIFVLSIVLLNFTSCSKSQKVTLQVYNWGDYINEDVLKIFTKETGIKISYSNFESNETMYSKINLSGVSYDVIFPSDYMISRMINENMLSEINLKNIPNIIHIADRFKNLDFDKNNKFHIPYMWGTVGILYNKNLVSDKVDSWDILWNDKYKKQIYMYNSERDTIGIALKKLGYSLNSTNEKEIEQAKNLLIKQKPLVQAYIGDPVKDKMIGNEGSLAVVYSGDALFSISENNNLDYVIPKEGSNVWIDGIVIPKNAKHKKEAEEFINFLCRPDIAALNVKTIGYTTANESALKLLDDKIINNKIFWISDEEFKKHEIFKDLGNFREIYSKAWIEILASNNKNK